MRLLLNVMAVLYNGLPDLREDSRHGYQMQKGANKGTHVKESSTIHIVPLLTAA